MVLLYPTVDQINLIGLCPIRRRTKFLMMKKVTHFNYTRTITHRKMNTLPNDDLLFACDKKISTLVLFLYLSAAFDTIDQDNFGIRGTSISMWEDAKVDFGVNQVSILGPKLFNIYNRPFPSQLQVVTVTVEGYADDHQLMKQFNLIFQVEVLGE